jgi:hypothetical protein
MGPRNRRRLIGSGMIVVVVIGLIVLLSHLPKHSGSSPTSAAQPRFRNSPAAARYEANYQRLIAGMTKKQVLRLMGPPATIVGGCWTYPPYVEAGAGPMYNQTIRSVAHLCFWGDIFETKMTVDKLWQGGRWQTPPVAGP